MIAGAAPRAARERQQLRELLFPAVRNLLGDSTIGTIGTIRRPESLAVIIWAGGWFRTFRAGRAGPAPDAPRWPVARIYAVVPPVGAIRRRSGAPSAPLGVAPTSSSDAGRARFRPRSSLIYDLSSPSSKPNRNFRRLRRWPSDQRHSRRRSGERQRGGKLAARQHRRDAALRGAARPTGDAGAGGLGADADLMDHCPARFRAASVAARHMVHWQRDIALPAARPSGASGRPSAATCTCSSAAPREVCRDASAHARRGMHRAD